MRTTANAIVVPLLAALAVAVAAEPAAAAPRRAGPTGTLTVRVGGLPAGFAVRGVVRGPRGVSRPVRRARQTFRRLPPGRYALRLRPARAARANPRRRIERGATALPQATVVRVVVPRHRRAALVGTYGTVLNPGVRPAPRRMVAAGGDASRPTALRVPAGRYRVGDHLLAGPRTGLPYGLSATVTGVSRRGGQQLLRVRSTPVSELVPEIVTPPGVEYAVGRPAGGRSAGAATPRAGGSLASWTLGSLMQQACPTFAGVRADAGLDLNVSLNGTGVRNVHVSATRAALDARFQLTFDAGLVLGTRLRCTGEAPLGPPIPFAIPAGPVVVPAYVEPKIGYDLSAGGKASFVLRRRTLSIDASIDSARNPSAQAVADYDSSGAVQASGKYELGAGVTLKGSVAIGVWGAADVAVKVGAGVKATYAPYGDGCTIDAVVGSLELEAKAGWFSLLLGQFQGITKRLFTEPACRKAPVPPVEGDWQDTSGAGAIRIVRRDDGDWDVIALTDLRLEGPTDCVIEPAGSTFRTLRLQGGKLIAPFHFYEEQDGRCALRYVDANGTLTGDGSSLLWCGQSDQFMRACDAFRRIGEEPDPPAVDPAAAAAAAAGTTPATRPPAPTDPTSPPAGSSGSPSPGGSGTAPGGSGASPGAGTAASVATAATAPRPTGRRLGVRLRCAPADADPATDDRCRGVVRLLRGDRRLGTARFRLAPGRSRAVAIRLRAADARRLRTASRTPLVLVVERDGQPPVRRRLVVRG